MSGPGYPTTPTGRKVTHENGMAIIATDHLELIRQAASSVRAQAAMLEQLCRGSMGEGRAGISLLSLDDAHARMKDTRRYLSRLQALLPTVPAKENT